VIRLGRGKWKGHILRPSSRLCRPTSSLVRSAFLDIAGRNTIDLAVVWDLCAGTGSAGLEALSWGASSCVFIDKNPRSTAFIRKFLREHNAVEDATVITCDAKDYINRADMVPDVVYIDPPYRYARLYEWIELIDWSSILTSDGIVFVESGSETVLGDEWNRRKYGDTCLNWRRMKEAI